MSRKSKWGWPDIIASTPPPKSRWRSDRASTTLAADWSSRPDHHPIRARWLARHRQSPDCHSFFISRIVVLALIPQDHIALRVERILVPGIEHQHVDCNHRHKRQHGKNHTQPVIAG